MPSNEVTERLRRYRSNGLIRVNLASLPVQTGWFLGIVARRNIPAIAVMCVRRPAI